MSAELQKTEQIYTAISRLVPLLTERLFDVRKKGNPVLHFYSPKYIR